MLAHIAYNSEGHIVKDFLEIEKNDETLEWEVFVSWRGLESTEDSWEPVDFIMRDVPAHLTKWLMKYPHNKNVRALCEALDIKIPTKRLDADISQIHPLPTATESDAMNKKRKRKSNP